jgi:hypothetical protein
VSRVLSRRELECIAVALLACLASVLLLANLGNRYLWQDEAQTALIAETVLSHGIPLGSDGRHSFSQERGSEYAENQLWKWHTWLSFYLVAGSFLVFGVGTFAARLPFALFGAATIVLTYYTARALWRDRRAAAAAAGLLLLCVPFLILSRQCRYYSVAAFFALLGLHAYAVLRRGDGRPRWLLFGAATLLFHTHHLYCGTLLATLLLHALFFDREKLRPLLLVSAGVAAFNLPWILWFSTIRYGENYADRLFDLTSALRYGRRFVRITLADFLHPLFLLIPPALAAWRKLANQKALDVRAETWSGAGLILLFCLVNIAALSLVSPGAYVRYLAPLAPPLALLAGLLVGALLQRSAVVGAGVIAGWIAALSLLPPRALPSFIHEITHDYDGPIEGIVEFLDEHGGPDDIVAITYGDLPLKFYTDLRVLGGLTGEDLAEAADADWIILRRHRYTVEEKRVAEVLLDHLSGRDYQSYTLDYPDIAWANREDIRLHHFSTVRDYPGVVVFGKRR